MSKLIYLASPYSHKNKRVMNLRAAIVDALGGSLVEQGYHIFGPITESKCYASNSNTLGEGWDHWSKHDYLMIDKCDEVWVACLKNWDKSVGVLAEIEYARSHGKPIKYLDVDAYLPELSEVL